MKRKVCECSVTTIYGILLTGIVVVCGQGNDVKFYYFSQKNPNLVLNINSSDTNSVNSETQVRFIIHGWTENRTTRWYPPLTNALMSRGYDVIQVDYAKPAALPYPVAVKTAITVGEKIASFIISLAKMVPYRNIQIIGHSLGGQVASYAATSFYRKTGKKLVRITALDPAGPFFEGFLNLNRRSLSPNDAEVVFVLHTDRNLFGYHGICGTIDVFPNGGGGIQPGCPKPNDNLFCSHHQSYWYYIYAMEDPDGLFAVKCSSYQDYLLEKCADSKVINLRDEVSSDDKGLYFLRTNGQKPYRLHP